MLVELSAIAAISVSAVLFHRSKAVPIARRLSAEAKTATAVLQSKSADDLQKEKAAQKAASLMFVGGLKLGGLLALCLAPVVGMIIAFSLMSSTGAETLQKFLISWPALLLAGLAFMAPFFLPKSR